MTTVTIVEPNSLVRLGLVKLLQGLTRKVKIEELDYTQLFAGATELRTPELMLLSVPEDPYRVVELIHTAQTVLAPHRFLLLSDTEAAPCLPPNLPPGLAGHINKHAARDRLLTAITHVLAGGTCFPHPDATSALLPERGPSAAALSPRRRWYDQVPIAAPSSEPPTTTPYESATNPGPQPPRTPAIATMYLEAATQSTVHSTPLPVRSKKPEPLSAKLIETESELLKLTPRQYQVLALLARGLPLKRISRELGISVSTTKTHSEALYLRLDVNNRNTAVFTAVSRGATLGWYSLTGETDAEADPGATSS